MSILNQDEQCETVRLIARLENLRRDFLAGAIDREEFCKEYDASSTRLQALAQKVRMAA